MDSEKAFEFINGHFEWSDLTKELVFISHEIVHEDTLKPVKAIREPDIICDKYEIGFREDIDLLDKIKFRKRYRRKITKNDPTVVLLQDVKDVVLFTANAKHLTSEFICFLHTPQVDRFLRALILYFQLYFQTWEELRNRRAEMEGKIPRPNIKNTASEDLADLRCIFAREYFLLLIGAEDVKKYHHSQGVVSMSERDRRLCEMVIQFSARMVWYALNKPSLSIIEQECDRLARSCHFNKFVHLHKLLHKPIADQTLNEQRILGGRSDCEQKRLKSMSSVGKEVMLCVHDHRLLAIGQVDFPPSDERLRFFEKLYLLPEEELLQNDINIGILGMPRENFDVTLKPKRKKVRADGGPQELVFKCHIPPRVRHSDEEISWKYPTSPPTIKYNERKRLLRSQCKLWIDRVQTAYAYDTSIREFTMESCASIFL